VITHLDATLIVQIILFGVFFWVLRGVLFRPLLAIFRQRAAIIEAGLRAAEESQRRVEETQREVQRRLDQARADAQGLIAAAIKEAGARRQELIAAAKAEADVLLRQAQEEIRLERETAIAELRRSVGSIAILAASYAVGIPLDAPAIHELADSAVAEVSGVGPT
jgi:F-type H+-transporting ATPase subunit b